jgi:hypothetical protein
VVAIFVLAAMSGNTVITIVGFLIYIFAFLILGPLAIHGSMKYRMSRTSWSYAQCVCSETEFKNSTHDSKKNIRNKIMTIFEKKRNY